MANRRLRLLAALALAALALVVIVYLYAALLPFLLSGLLAYLLLPLVNTIDRRLPGRRRWPQITRALSASLVTALTLGAVLAILALGLLKLINESTALVELAPDLIREGELIWTELGDAYRERVPDSVREIIDPRLVQLRGAVIEAAAVLLVRVSRVLQSGISLIISLVAVPIILFYLLYDPAGLGRGVRRMLPPPVRADLSAIARLSGGAIGGYLRMQLALGVMVGIFTGLGLWAIGAPQPLLLGLVAAAGELIPIVGPAVSLIVAILVTLVTEPAKTPYAAALYLAVQGLQNVLLVPRLQGRALGLHPLTIILALALFGLALGFLGALIAVPFTAAGHRALRYVVAEWQTAGDGDRDRAAADTDGRPDETAA